MFLVSSTFFLYSSDYIIALLCSVLLSMSCDARNTSMLLSTCFFEVSQERLAIIILQSFCNIFINFLYILYKDKCVYSHVLRKLSHKEHDTNSILLVPFIIL